MVVNEIRALLCPCHAPTNRLYFKCVCCTFRGRFGVMVRFFHCHFMQISRRGDVIVLAFALMLGYLCGGICSTSAELNLFSLMRTGVMTGVSIVCLLPVLLLPFMLSVVSVYAGQWWCLLPVAFAKAFLFSYLCCHILIQLPDSGPLFAGLFLCADGLSLPVLCWFWIRSMRVSDGNKGYFLPVFLLITGIGLFDYQVVSPFLASLLS